MSFLGSIFNATGGLLGGLLGGVASLLFHKKKEAPLQLPAPVTRDAARDQTATDDELRRRKGAASDMLTGTQGAEATGGSIGRLVVGN